MERLKSTVLFGLYLLFYNGCTWKTRFLTQAFLNPPRFIGCPVGLWSEIEPNSDLWMFVGTQRNRVSWGVALPYKSVDRMPTKSILSASIRYDSGKVDDDTYLPSIGES